MKKSLSVVLVCLAMAVVAPAQMTPDQKMLDFSQLAATYAMNYGPIQWKRDFLNFDLLNIGDWLNKAMATKDDLDFYEVCVAYVASLNDAHDAFNLPSDFQAYLGFTVDVYDGKTIIEFIDRNQLRTRDYPFQVGDELVSIDGVATADLLQQFIPYSIAANPLSTRRIAADSITFRSQAYMPHAHVIPNASTVVINRQTGGTQSFAIPWATGGTPITLVGPVISPFSASTAQAKPEAAAPATPAYMKPLMRLRNLRLPQRKAILGFGDPQPVFTLPSGFVLRQGSDPQLDFFYSGTYQAQGKTIGYIRIPSFDTFLPSDDFQTEIDYMQQNTDGLIVDIMRNPGGDLCAAEDLLSRIMPSPFQNIGLEIRATRSWVAAFQQAVQDAEDFGAPPIIVKQLQDLLKQVTDAFLTPSGRTPPLPVCDTTLTVSPATDDSGNPIAYTKPVMLLTDELTASAADYFAGVFQDNQRGLVFGNRTMGAGGNVDTFQVTTYSEGVATLTESLMHRLNPVTTPDYPTAPYIENIGVHPDIAQDYMTIDNLKNNGAAFVQAFTNAAVTLINSGSKTTGTTPELPKRETVPVHHR